MTKILAFYPELVHETGSHVGAAALSQIMYWTPRATITRKGSLWIAKPRAELCAEVGMTLDQYKRVMPLLVELGWIVQERGLFANRVTPHLQLTAKGKAWLAGQQGAKAVNQLVALTTNQLVAKDPNPLVAKDPNLITENTAEITTYKKGCAMKASEVVHSLQGKTTTIQMMWKKKQHEITGKWVYNLTGKDLGFMKVLKSKWGVEHLTALSFVMDNWPRYTNACKSIYGLSNVPEKPLLSFMAAYAEPALQLIAVKTETKQKDATIPTPVFTPVAVIKTTPVHIVPEEEWKATLESLKL